MSKQRYFRPRNWERFQHYKDRRPPWIKLHTETLSDTDIMSLSPARFKVLVTFWIWYSQQEASRVPADSQWIARQLPAISQRETTKALDYLVSNDFIEIVEEDASGALAKCSESAPPENRVQRTEQTPSESSAPDAAPSPPDDDLKSRIFGKGLDWLADKSAKPTHTLRSMVGRWCRDHGDGVVLEAMIEAQRAGAVEPVAYIERLLRNGDVRDGPASQARQQAIEEEVLSRVMRAAKEADRRNGNQLSTDSGDSFEQAEHAVRASPSDDCRQSREPSVYGGNANLHGGAAAFPAVGIGGGHQASARESSLQKMAASGGTPQLVHSSPAGGKAAVGSRD